MQDLVSHITLGAGPPVVNGKIPKIVVIDDSPSSLSLYQRSIASLEVELATCRTSEDARRRLDAGPVDLIFLDILMQDIDGIRLLREIRRLEHASGTPVVIVTSKDYFQDRARARELDARDYMVKPLRSQEIRDIIFKYTSARSIAG